MANCGLIVENEVDMNKIEANGSWYARGRWLS